MNHCYSDRGWLDKSVFFVKKVRKRNCLELVNSSDQCYCCFSLKKIAKNNTFPEDKGNSLDSRLGLDAVNTSSLSLRFAFGKRINRRRAASFAK